MIFLLKVSLDLASHLGLFRYYSWKRRMEERGYVWTIVPLIR
jgi:hypothetical protein